MNRPPLSLAWRRIVAALLVVVVLVAGLLLMRAAGVASSAGSHSNRVSVVAAETFYGSMLQQIGGKNVEVTSLLDNPAADPHEFEASPETARDLAGARLVVKNGIGYDSWVDKLLGASPRSDRRVISVGELLGHRRGDNPHVWYDPRGWTRVADAMATALASVDPPHRSAYMAGKVRYLQALQPVRREIASIRSRAHAAPVTATEPVFGYMAEALGLQMRNLDFQKAVMDGTDPAPQAVGRFEADLKTHQVQILLYNSQTAEPITTRVRSLAQQEHIPTLGVSELTPPGQTFPSWQLRQLKALARALNL